MTITLEVILLYIKIYVIFVDYKYEALLIACILSEFTILKEHQRYGNKDY